MCHVSLARYAQSNAASPTERITLNRTVGEPGTRARAAHWCVEREMQLTVFSLARKGLMSGEGEKGGRGVHLLGDEAHDSRSTGVWSTEVWRGGVECWLSADSKKCHIRFLKGPRGDDGSNDSASGPIPTPLHDPHDCCHPIEIPAALR